MASFDNEHTRSFAIALAAGTVASFFQPQAIASVPQILGLVASSEPTPLSCSDGMCGAEFSSFCLQQNKPSPLTGTEYRASESSEIALVYTRADGSAEEVDVTPYVAIDSSRSYAAVRITLPEGFLKSLGAVGAAVRVGEQASAVPKTLADDRSPTAVAEVRNVTGELRGLAERLFDPSSDSAVIAARALHLVNLQARLEAPIVVPDHLSQCAAPAARDVVGCLRTIHQASITQANIRVWDGLKAADVNG